MRPIGTLDLALDAVTDLDAGFSSMTSESISASGFCRPASSGDQPATEGVVGTAVGVDGDADVDLAP